MSDMPERVRRCTTHHHACDCREYEFEQAKVRIEELTAEAEEQARLLGASGSREVELLARVEALESLLQAEQDSNHRLSAKELELAARNEALEEELKYIGNYAIGAASRMDNDFAKSRFAEIERRCKALLQEPTK